jgi:hypothetical protein
MIRIETINVPVESAINPGCGAKRIPGAALNPLTRFARRVRTIP